MISGSLSLSDLTFEVQGSLYAYLGNGDRLDWCVEMMSISETPFSVYIAAVPFKELNFVNFNISENCFSIKINNSSSFAISSGGDMMFIDSFDVSLQKQTSRGMHSIHLAGEGRVDPMAGPNFMRNISCSVSLVLTLDYFQVSDLLSIDDATWKIKEFTGIKEQIKFLKDGSGGTRLYGIEYNRVQAI